MGTNYYVRRANDTDGPTIHLGKASMGWVFTFYEPEPERPQKSAITRWLMRVVDSNNIIENEYGQVEDPVEFIEYVLSKQTEKYSGYVYNGSTITGPYDTWEYFHNKYDFMSGPFYFTSGEFS
jgi:hypothetical protein